MRTHERTIIRGARSGLAVCAVVAVFATGMPRAYAAAAWTVQATPNAAIAVLDTDLNGVICNGPTQCFAVGSALDHPIIRRWTGTTWVNVVMTDPQLINPPGIITSGITPTSIRFESVACLPATSCFVVGTQSTIRATPAVHAGWIARSSGTTFTSVANGTTLLSSPQLHSVSCTTTMCVAVGEARTSSASNAGTRTVAVRWNGSTWALQSTPNVAGAASSRLRSVKCTSATNCVAVGFSTTGSTTRTLIERWNGTAWSIVTSPNPSGATTSALHAVACPEPTTCFAVGSTKTGTTQTTLIERWNGTAWSIVTSPTPPGATVPKWSGVACAGTGMCMAVGTSGTLPMSARWNGTSWLLLATPNVAGSPNTALAGVNCVNAISCFAVGRRAIAGSSPLVFQRLIEGWNGTAWSITAEAIDGANSGHSDVACSTATNCFAVGGRNDANGTHALIQRWQGGSWFNVTAPIPPGGGSHSLLAITCPGPSSCFAVGRHQPPGATDGLVMRWNGVAWSVQTLPSDPQVDELRGVGCASTTSCFAVGFSGSASKILRWNGTTWTTSPSGTVNTAELSSVACATTTMCMAVGLIRDFVVSGPNRSYALRWDGTLWSEAPDPGDAALIGEADASAFFTISCPSTTRCFAAGSRFIPFIGIGDVPYMRQWDAGTWTSPGSVPLSGRRFSDIACPTSTSCVAVGETYYTSGVEVTPGAVIWNGSTWAATPSPIRPAGAQQAWLNGIACTSATVCVAAGSWTSTTGTRTLIERYA